VRKPGKPDKSGNPRKLGKLGKLGKLEKRTSTVVLGRREDCELGSNLLRRGGFPKKRRLSRLGGSAAHRHSERLEEETMATYLVTGGAGFIGSSLAEKLLEGGDTVRVIDDFSTGRRQNLANLRGKLEVIEGTICDAETVKRAVKGVEVIFHQAAIPSVARSVDNPAATMMVSVQGTTILLEAARHEKVRRVVYAASSSAYGNTPTLPKVETMAAAPLSPYAVAKLAGELLMRVYAHIHGLETISLRYFNVFGPKQDPTSHYAAVIPNFITAALTGKRPVVHGDGEQTRDFCFIDNTVGANILAATTSSKLTGQMVNIACGDRTSLNQLLGLIAEETNTKLEADHKPTRAGDVRDSLADIDAARKLIGYEPKVKIREGLRRTIGAFREFTK
jgi:UDP-glucose 4-epimerase